MTKPIFVKECDIQSLTKVSYDLFIATVGFEERSTYIARTIKFPCLRKLAIGFKDRQVINYSKNRDWFKNNEFDYLELSDCEFKQTFIKALEEVPSDREESVRIAVDISCLNRYRLAVIIDTICSDYLKQKKLEVDFLYVIAEFSPPPPASPINTHVGPVIPEFAGWSTDPMLPPAAIIGLGFEEGKALAAVDHLEVAQAYALIPSSPVSEYLPAVEKANASLLGTLRPGHAFKYQVDDPVRCFYIIESIISGISSTFNPVILPFGPKIFTVCALLVAKQYPNSSVWRVSAGDSEEPSDRRASNHVVGLKVAITDSELNIDASD